MQASARCASIDNDRDPWALTDRNCARVLLVIELRYLQQYIVNSPNNIMHSTLSLYLRLLTNCAI